LNCLLQLRLLSVNGIAAAVKNFIEKDDKDSISTIVERQLKKTMDNVATRDMDDDDDDAIDDALDCYRKSVAG
jgi:hypothetical protein